MNKTLFAVAVVSLFFALTAYAFALQEVKIGAPTVSFRNYLPVFAAEEGGFSKQNDVKLEWTPLRGGPTLNAAVAAGHIKIAISISSTILLGAQGGLPVIIVARVIDKGDYLMWTRTDSRFQAVQDLKGALLGVHSLGSTSHAYSRMVVKAAGLEKDVKFAGTGGIREVVGALLAGAVDVAAGYNYSNFVKAVLEGKVRPIVNISDYMPDDWIDNAVYTHRDFARTNPELVRRVVRSIAQGINYTKKNRQWGISKIILMENLSEKEAALAFDYDARYTADPRLTDKGLENVISFLAEYKIIDRAKLPPTEALFTNRFLE